VEKKKKAKKSSKSSKKQIKKAKTPPKKTPPKQDNKDKHPGGRPPFFKTPQELQEKINDYFDSCWVDKIIEVTDKEGNCTATNSRYQNRPYTIAGLAEYLGFCSRTSLLDYDAKMEFLNIIKKAKLKVEMNVEEFLLEGKNAAGPIFWLKNHADYKDKQEHEITGKDGGPIKHTELTDEDLLIIAARGRAGTSEKKKGA
jgi:hypothetical protein